MAKFGQGDPRWIVEERPDATNVNNWHWTEKNATEWSKNRLRELLVGLECEDKVGKCEITSIAEISGEASVSNRKAKLIFFYEWQLELTWTGKIAGDETVYEGKISVLNLSEEYKVEEVDVDVSVKNSSEESEKLKKVMKTKGTPLIKNKFGTYLKELKEEYSKDIILPTKGQNGPSEALTQKVASLTTKSQPGSTTDNAKKPLGVPIATEDLTLTQEFHCAADDIYRALTIPEMIRAFTHGNAIVDPVKGGKFELFGGSVTGEFVELVKDKKIVQKWRFSSWPDAHYSVVTLSFKQTESGTIVDMKQTGIPKSDFGRTKDGWKRYYWDSMKATFGFGAMLT